MFFRGFRGPMPRFPAQVGGYLVDRSAFCGGEQPDGQFGQEQEPGRLAPAWAAWAASRKEAAGVSISRRAAPGGLL